MTDCRGVSIWLVAALGLTRALKGLLFELSVTDPPTFMLIAALLLGVALLARYAPARRTTKVDPMTALRRECVRSSHLINFLQNLGGFMKQKRFSTLLASILLVIAVIGCITARQSPNTAASQAPPEYGPAKGTLVIVGGGSTDGTGIIETFIRLAGGPDAKFVIVPTAGGNKTGDGQIRVYNEEI